VVIVEGLSFVQVAESGCVDRGGRADRMGISHGRVPAAGRCRTGRVAQLG
jgi:hypothetical protein